MIDDELFYTDNQGDWLPSSKLLKIKQGEFLGSHINPDHAWAGKPVTPPVAWLPQGECSYDIRVVWQGGESQERRNMNMCALTNYTVR